MIGVDAIPRPIWVVLAMAVGWVVGTISAGVAGRLDQPVSLAPRSALLPDLVVQALAATVAGLLALRWGSMVPWLAAIVIAVPLLQVGITDLRYHWVYLAVAGVGTAVGVLLSPLLHGGPWWAGLAGASAGLVSFAVLYGLGRLLYRGEEPLARGDLWIASMVGAAAGTLAANALITGVVFSGLLAVVWMAFHRSRRALMPYGPGLCLGGLLTLFQ